jgi:hypothetical protein
MQITYVKEKTYQHPTLEACRENVTAHGLRRFGGAAD